MGVRTVIARLLPEAGPEVVVECRQCGATVSLEVESCPECGGTDFAQYRISE